MRPIPFLVIVALVAAACTATPVPSSPAPDVMPSSPLPTPADTPPDGEPWPSAPPVPAGEVSVEAAGGVERLIGAVTRASFDREALAAVAAARDPRLGWILADLLRFIPAESTALEFASAFEQLSGVDPVDERFGAIPWLQVTNLMLAWDLPAPPDYLAWKRDLYTTFEPKWTPFFADEASAVDWRWISWGGVFIDDRVAGDATLCERGCIPALDDPELTDVAGGTWYGDDRPVFAIEVGGEAVAFPKHMMEVHEMVNLTVGGRRIGMPYCTLCGSAQAYLTDAVPGGIETPVLRTTGLLSRSNKVMYDLVTRSLFNTFTGRAISGPLHEAGIVLEPVSVVSTTWGAWKAEHPDTRILAEDGGIGRTYPDDPLGGRDDDGPIFPVGQPDLRLPVHAHVLGVIGPDGPVAFPAEAASAALADGRPVELGGVSVVADGGGLRARIGSEEVPTHEAFWFAWSQFHPDTALWVPPAAS